jgi:hypothetical protein
MPQPSITTVSARNFGINDSKAFIAGFRLPLQAFDTQSVTVEYPAEATDPFMELEIQVDPPLPPIDLFAIPSGSGQEVSGHIVTVVIAPPVNDRITLTCNIAENTGNGNSLGNNWRLRSRRDTAVRWTLGIGGAATTEIFVASDPRAVLTAPVTDENLLEQDPFTLTAALATGLVGAQTVVGTLPADLAPGYRFSHTGPIAMNPLPAFSATHEFTLTLPGVYQPTPVDFSVSTSFGGTAPGNTAFLQNVSEPVPTSLTTRPQHIVIVLDQSFSMSQESRWTNAIIGTRMLTNLIAVGRAGVNADDRIGIVSFTDAQNWHAAPPSPLVKTLLPLTPLAAAKDAVNKLDFGDPEAETPIGDGLVAGLDLLASGGPPGTKQFTLVLLTDGFQNAGSVFVGTTVPNTGLPPGTVKSFNGTLNDAAHPLREQLRNSARRFVIPLGATVETTVLNELAATNGFTGFLPVAVPEQLAESFGETLHFSQDVNRLIASTTAPPGLPPAELNRIHFSTGAGADRLMLAVLSSVPNSTIRLERWDGSTFVTETVQVDSSETHHVTSVANVPAISTAAIHWRVTLRDANAAPGADPLALAPASVLAYEDLHLKADVLLDKPEYLTGDDLTLTVRVRRDFTPILGARIRAELDAPDSGVGEELSVAADSGQHRGSPPSLEERIGAVMRRHGWTSWPHHEQPKGLFVDGTDELHDFDGDGNYTNTFNRIFAEGPYTWRLFVDGADTDGAFFGRQLTIATAADVKVSARATKVQTVRIPNHPSRLRAVRVIITPQDVRRQRLGPGKDATVIWQLDRGQFEHIHDQQPAPVFTDGTYQRVVLFRNHERPVVRVNVTGVLLRPISLDDSSGHDDDGDDKTS